MTFAFILVYELNAQDMVHFYRFYLENLFVIRKNCTACNRIYLREIVNCHTDLIILNRFYYAFSEYIIYDKTGVTFFFAFVKKHYSKAIIKVLGYTKIFNKETSV